VVVVVVVLLLLLPALHGGIGANTPFEQLRVASSAEVELERESEAEPKLQPCPCCTPQSSGHPHLPWYVGMMPRTAWKSLPTASSPWPTQSGSLRVQLRNVHGNVFDVYTKK